MTQKETNVWRQIQLDLSPLGFRLFRNQRYKGKSDKGAWLDCGVGGDGGSDLIGFRVITITPDMVGKQLAQFAAIEAKFGKNKATKTQIDFLNAVRGYGGIGILAYSVDDVTKALCIETKGKLKWT